MHYTNNETDMALRRKNFIVSVYLLPAAIMVVLSGLVYWAFTQGYLSKVDGTYGYFILFMPVSLLHSINKRNWLKMPDGTYHNVKEKLHTTKFNMNEPAYYEAEYFYSKTSKSSMIFLGIASLVFSAWFIISKLQTLIIPLLSIGNGLYFIYAGVKALRDKSAQLKIAKTGLWTKQLGFVHWDDINFAEVVVEEGEPPQKYLYIRLKGTKYEQARKPDQRLLLSGLKDKDSIEMVINNSVVAHNAQKNAQQV